jgi:electron transport complex protein RnfC
MIAEQNGYVSSPAYSSVSGTVKKITEIPYANGTKVPAVIIESDGEMRVDPAISAPTVSSKEEFVEAIRLSGVVGLGGAGFPTYVKFNVPDGVEIEELIVNSAECEPYITSDTRTMIDRTDDLTFAIEKVIEFIGVKRVIIGIEANKKEAIAKMREYAASNEKVTVKVLSSLYPQGGEKVLVYHTTGKVIPAGKLPIDVGAVVCNCTTLAAIGNYIKTGMPLVSKCVTVDGGAVASPKNLIVPIGTSIADVLEYAGGFSTEPAKILLGGPMMGITVPDMSVPVAKNTNAIIALNEKEAAPKRQTACIRCGACVSHCPFNLSPVSFLKAYKNEDMEELAALRVDICMECGCCSYVCPTGQPLVETHKLAKSELREWKIKREQAEKEAANNE